MLQKEPVTLYYMIPASSLNPNSSRQFQFNPVEIDDPSLQLLAVTLNGAQLESFDSARRLITLDADESGILELQFGPTQ